MNTRAIKRSLQAKTVQTETYISIAGIGEIRMRRSAKAKHMRLRIDKNGVTAVLPVLYPERQALKFIEEKRSWIKRTLAKQKNIQETRTVFNEQSEFQTRYHRLFMERHSKNTIKSVVGGKRIHIWFPQHAEADDERIQRVVRRAIEEAWRIEAKRYLPQKVAELAAKHGFTYKKLSIKNAKTRWGSCSAENNINLNLQLMRLPEPLIDYVILHELVHTQFKHHQKTFWKKLEHVYPGAKKHDKELNNFHLSYW